jgi:parallel beta-helix repeat protein
MKDKYLYNTLLIVLIVLFLNISSVSATNTTFSIDEVTNASSSVQTYVETNHQLPQDITISGTTLDMSKFLKLETTTIYNINNNITTEITLGNFNTANNPSETITTTGNLTKANYLTLNNNIISFMNSNGRAPNYQTISLGNMRYENLVYTFAEILNSYRIAKVLPDFIVVRPWTMVTNNKTTFISMGQIKTAADTVQIYVETNHQLPEHVTIAGSTVNMPQFLKLETHCIINGNGNLYQSIPLINYQTAPNPSETITGGNLEKNDYLSAAADIITFMDTNGRAPNCKTTIKGNIRYESLVYMYAILLNSAGRNLVLPNYITLIPWTTVSNSNTVFLTMDQINTAAMTVKSSVETHHSLPSYITISGRQITMPQFLKLEITSIKNIYAGLYQSIMLKNYNYALNPTETITYGKINYENYMNVAENIRLYMNSNERAPDYQSCNLGNMRFESLVYMYAQLLNYYNVNNTLPPYITVNPWSVVINPNTVNFNQGQIIDGAETVISYIETNHSLPNNINISGTTVSMPQFLKLALTTLSYINGNSYGQITLGNCGVPGSTSETITGGYINQIDYLNLAKDVENFMIANGRAPNYQTSSLGNIKYQSLVYLFSQILSSYKANNYILPEIITIRPWSVISNPTTKFITIDQIETGAKTVKNYIETNHTLPANVNINSTSVNMPNFLKLITTATINVNGKLNSTIVLQNYNPAPSPSETINGGNINIKDYLSLSNSIISFMDTNGRAPNYQTSIMGNIRFESLVFMFSQIMDYYSTEKNLPPNITINKWSLISNTNKPFLSLEQIKNAAATVQYYIETNHTIPNNVNISGITVTMPQFLQLAASAVINIEEISLTSFVLGTYNSPPNPSEDITNRTFSKEDYTSLANDVIAFMYANGRAPNYKASSHGNIQYQTLIYMFSQILNSNNATDTLPQSITINPWNTVTNPNTIFFSLNQIKTAAETIKTYIDNNHQLPNTITISGNQITMTQFLKLSAQSVLNIGNYLNTSVILETVGTPNSPYENITCGVILSSEFMDLADKTISYINSNGRAPNNITDTSLGEAIRYESLIYMFSKILISYNPSEHSPDNVSIIPWLALSNPDKTYNFKTHEVFNSIQAAIDDTDTIKGDTIWLGNLNYSESVIINKKIIIKPLQGIEVNINALSSKPALIINSGGNGSIIQDLIIKGSADAGIYINNSNDNLIIGNKITGFDSGISLYNSKDNIISENEISNTFWYGILINNGSNNEISSNSITETETGIFIQNSNDNCIYSNKISKNRLIGIHLKNSSTEIHYNIIIENRKYGLYNEGNGIIDATNNWWGSNNPIISSNFSSDIYSVGGIVNYNPWLIISLYSSTDRSDRDGDYYNYLITADLTHNNQGSDTSSNGNIPDNIPINFQTSLGTLNSSAITKKGKAEAKINSNSAGTAVVSASSNNQTVTHQLTITSANILGVYNTSTQKSFATIQEAVDDVDTLNGDTITLAEGTYTENIIINKKLIIKPFNGSNVTVKSDKADKSVIVIDNDGSGSTIQNLQIIGSTDSYGIALSHAYNITLNNNIILNSSKGVYLYLSSHNIINSNILEDNYYAIALYQSTDNIISENKVKNNETGIYLYDSNNNQIKECTINENWYGINLYHSNNNNISNNNIETNWVGIYLHDTDNNSITDNDITKNGAGITYYNSISTTLSENRFTDNWLADTSVIDSGKMVMATTIYSCGPAALATILKSIGIFTTEAELAELSGTDETGTSLYGLKIAAQSKGISAIGARLTTDQLETNYIVVLSINGRNHVEVVQNITENTIILFDPNLGIIEMSLDKFNELYTGIALVINDSLPPGTVQLTNDEMRDIKAMWHYETIAHSYYVPGYYYWTYEWIDTSFWLPYLYLEYVSGYYLWDVIPIPGHYELRLGWYHVSCGFWMPQLHYVPGYYMTYYTTEILLDSNDIPNIQLSYEWKGFGVVQDRIYYGGGRILIGALSGPGSIYLIWDGLNEYAQNLDKVGSQGWINPKN